MFLQRTGLENSHCVEACVLHYRLEPTVKIFLYKTRSKMHVMKSSDNAAQLV